MVDIDSPIPAPVGVLDAFWRYDAALLANDRAALDELFLPGPGTLRTAAIQLGSRENSSGFYPDSGDFAVVRAAALQLTGQIDANYRKVFGHKVEEDLQSS